MTVIDDYSRYLLACHFTPSYGAANVCSALDAARCGAERWHGPLTQQPFLVTDNGPRFLAHAFRRHIDGDYAHVRIQYRTPTQLGLLERFHQTLKTEAKCTGNSMAARVRQGSRWKCSRVDITRCARTGR